jgi:hypothetical protein
LSATPPLARAEPQGRAHGPVIGLFATTLLLSAALVFSVQPMFARFVLPTFGGAPAVWNTSMLFFQTALLAGYLYAHVSVRRLGVRRQGALHIGVLLLPLIALPLGVPEGWSPSGGVAAVPLLLGVLLVGVGLPFFAASTTAPLLQRWLAASDHPAARDPYFLYRASNAGSIAGLLAYPLVAEPALRLADQSRVWAAGYLLLIALVAACAVFVWRSGDGRSVATARDAEPSDPQADRVSATRRLRWIGLAFVPSSLMLGVTSYMTLDLAPVPLLWTVPLSLYLLSFVLAFAPGARNERRHRVAVVAFPAVALVLSVTVLLEVRDPLWLLLPLHLAGFLLAALVCHGELARDRPAPRRLTEFYLWLAAGGAFGGAFNALLAPAVLDSLVEYPLAIVLACLCLPRRPARVPPGRYARWLDLGLPVLLAAAVAAVLAVSAGAGPQAELVARGFAVSAAAGIALNFARRPLRFGLSLAAILLAAAALTPAEPVLDQERTFFGVNRVELQRGGFHHLVNGTTTHGGQYLTPTRRLEPVTYYHPSGPIGQVMAGVPRDERSDRVAVLGLGSGALACYARPVERWTFYEIDPAVARMARDARLFTYLRDCPGRRDIALGDARLSLVKAPNGAYEVIVGDVFSSDAIPVHMLTREAVRLYRTKLTPRGVLALHISNRYADLEPVVGELARDAGLVCLAQSERPGGSLRAPAKIPSRWAVMARRPPHLGRLTSDGRWHPCRRPEGGRVWTDDFSNVVEALDLGGSRTGPPYG